MAPLVARGDLIALASEVALILIDASNGSCRHVELPVLTDPKNLQNPPPAKPETKSGWKDWSHIATGASVALSHCSTYVAVCTSNKSLTLWKVENLELVHQWEVPRKVSSLYFARGGQRLIVADKAGDCYTYSWSPINEKGTLLLGHLSMLLDVVISDEDKYIITCERDEKIRISHFPNAYNIHTFCLGHTEFVTSLALLPDNRLLSGSGDASVRLWDYVQGKQLHCESVRLSSEDEMEKAVRSVVTYTNGDTSLAVVLLNRCKKIIIYHIVTESPKFECRELSLDCHPLAAVFTGDGHLYALTDDPESPIKHFKPSDDSNYIPESASTALDQLHNNKDRLKIIQECAQSCNGDMKPLYKRWFDNMQSYRERKEERLAGKEGKSPIAPDCKKLRVE